MRRVLHLLGGEERLVSRARGVRYLGRAYIPVTVESVIPARVGVTSSKEVNYDGR